MAAQCSYCGSDLRPNSMFCLDCGQLVARQGPDPAGAGSRSDRSESTAPPQPRVADAPASPPAPSPAASPSALPPQATTASAPSVEAPATPPGRTATAYVWVLTVDGAEHVLTRDVFVGRRPAPDAGADAIPVDDAGRTVSRNHAAIRRRGDVLTIEDLGSANGTHVERAGRTATCRPGEPIAIGHGDVLGFGDVRATLIARVDG